MSKFFYVDTREVLREPKPGRQFVAWYGRGSMTYPEGYPYVDVINSEEVQIRSMDEEILTKWLRSVYQRAPYIKAKLIVEEEVSY